jgi:hypothetical protein
MKQPKVITLNFKRIRIAMAGWKPQPKPAAYDFESFIAEWRHKNASRISRTRR